MKFRSFANVIALVAAMAAPAGTFAAEKQPNVTPDEALKRLMEGNARFVAGKSTHPEESLERRAAQAKAQEPFAVVVGCSDSRVAPELVFDHGVGTIFVVRTAGHLLDDLVLASIEYGVEHLNCPLVVVLGHERCGAVSAAVEADSKADKEEAAGKEAARDHIPTLVAMLSGAVNATQGIPGDHVENAVQENVRLVTRDMADLSPALSEHVASGTLKIIGMRYDLDTGEVTPVEGAPRVLSLEKSE